MRDFVGMNPEIENELRFDSQFESGNLDMVIKKTHGQSEPGQNLPSNDRLYYNRI